MPWNVHSVTLKLRHGHGQLTGNDFLDANKSLSRVQAYSPTLRATQGGKHACGGVQLSGETLLDISQSIVHNDNGGYIKAELALEKLTRFISLAGDHIHSISRLSGTVCRLELTFKGDEKGLDDEFYESSLVTLMKTFHGSVKAYDCKVICDLGRIALSAMQGLGNAVIMSRGPNFLPFVPDYNEFGEAWACLQNMAINFFSGRSSLTRQTSYCPKLSYLYSRFLLKSSWTGINATFVKLCNGQRNFNELRKMWYKCGGIDEGIYSSTILKNGHFLINFDSGSSTATQVDAFNRLFMSHSNRGKNSSCRAVVCPICFLMTSESESALETWASHPCQKSDYISGVKTKTLSINSCEYEKYLFYSVLSLSLSQKEAYIAILDSKMNFFLTGVAGSGKSHTLNCVYPRLVFYYGYQCVQLSATTNRAAANINGITIHRLLGLMVSDEATKMINKREKESSDAVDEHVIYLNENHEGVIEKLTLLKCLIIDEAGMLSEDLHYFLSALLKKIKNNPNPFGGVRIILVGDVLQLPPVETKLDALGLQLTARRFFFSDSLNFNSSSYRVAYLKENHRQKNDLFLSVLNMVRLGDKAAVDILNGNLFSNSNVSKQTLLLATEQSKEIFKVQSDKSKLENRVFNRGFLLENRVYFEKWANDIVERTKIAADTGYSDLIVCCEKKESECYQKLRFKMVKDSDRYICDSIDSSSKISSGAQVAHNDSNFAEITTKLLKRLEIVVGMQYKISCQTDNKYFCTNTLVTIDKICMQESSVHQIEVSTQNSFTSKQTTILSRLTIVDTALGGKVSCSRNQFPLISSVGLLPWSLQCMTITDNIFYDNSRMGGLSGSPQKGFLYTILSRVKDMNQICILHPVSNSEVTSGVHLDARKFDDFYRTQNEIIMNVVD